MTDLKIGSDAFSSRPETVQEFSQLISNSKDTLVERHGYTAQDFADEGIQNPKVALALLNWAVYEHYENPDDFFTAIIEVYNSYGDSENGFDGDRAEHYLLNITEGRTGSDLTSLIDYDTREAPQPETPSYVISDPPGYIRYDFPKSIQNDSALTAFKIGEGLGAAPKDIGGSGHELAYFAQEYDLGAITPNYLKSIDNSKALNSEDVVKPTLDALLSPSNRPVLDITSFTGSNLSDFTPTIPTTSDVLNLTDFSSNSIFSEFAKSEDPFAGVSFTETGSDTFEFNGNTLLDLNLPIASIDSGIGQWDNIGTSDLLISPEIAGNFLDAAPLIDFANLGNIAIASGPTLGIGVETVGGFGDLYAVGDPFGFETGAFNTASFFPELLDTEDNFGPITYRGSGRVTT